MTMHSAHSESENGSTRSIVEMESIELREVKDGQEGVGSKAKLVKNFDQVAAQIGDEINPNLVSPSPKLSTEYCG